MAIDDPVFAFSVEQELDKAAALLARGLAAQRAPHYTDTARFLILVDLAGGLRQLLKLARVLLTATPAPAEPAPALPALLEAVLAVFPRLVWRTDEGENIYQFLRNDALLKEIVFHLEAFERFRAGEVLDWPGTERRPRNPEFAWRQMERGVAEQLFPEEEERHHRQLSADPAAYQQPVNDEVARVLTRCVDDLFTVLSRTSNLKAVRTGPARWRQLLGQGRA